MRTEIYEPHLSGMICPECEDEAASALLHLRGVISADVSYRRAAAKISYDPDIITPDQIDHTLSESGYPVGGDGRYGVAADIIAVVAVALLTLLIPKLTALVPVPSATSAVDIGAIFLVGLFTGVHCIGMCGGIMLTQCQKIDRSYIGAAFYNLGRVLSYTVAGAIFGAIGKIISYDTAFRSMLFTMCGALVVLIGLRMWGVPFLRSLSVVLRPPCELPSSLRNKAFGRPLIVGLLTGLMPCGALSAMWLLSASSGSASRGMLCMLSFALGTSIPMLIFGTLGALIPKKYNKYVLKLSTVLVVALGLCLMIKGLKLL